MTDRDNLRAYYEHEAEQQSRQPLVGRRVTFREQFVAQLRKEGRGSVIDFGAGPGRDGEAFLEAGLDFVGVDLAHGNCRLAAERGVVVVHGSVDAIPVQPKRFEAGWSMSTLMHLPEASVIDALRAMTGSLQSGAPLAIGVWGGELGALVESETDGFERQFFLRTLAQNTSLMQGYGAIESSETWDVGPDGWDYQVVVLRVP